ncbi:dnaJ homolog subfamily C member 9 [Neocloeon triangulifer]|uniref:dnaJ homolog subfamily C member 9 n=1 Tax=Neocloeon triangulifer TaxID=2078957 RepID=UPI00286F8F7F|nr:dnaJ homolog subfamily C member 9 [Neocloeon triangulifer]
MSSLKDLCELHFGTTDIYEVLGIDPKASEKEVKNAYRKMSLKIHPDRVEESEKKICTEKFQILGKIHTILSDKEKRKVYDRTGDVDSDLDADWLDYWRSIFKPVTKQDIVDYEKKYKGSEEERNDLKSAYNTYKGDMNSVMDAVPFADMEDEERLTETLREMIENEEVEDFDAFSKETKQKKLRRKKKMERRRKEFEKAKEADEVPDEDSLSQAILQRKMQREGAANDFFSALEAKYCNGSKKSETKTSGRNKKQKTK